MAKLCRLGHNIVFILLALSIKSLEYTLSESQTIHWWTWKQ